MESSGKERLAKLLGASTSSSVAPRDNRARPRQTRTVQGGAGRHGLPTHFHVGNCLDVLKGYEDNSFGAILTDPGIGYSGDDQAWDKGIPVQRVWEECLRVARPGAHMAVFGSAKRFYLVMAAAEGAGWEPLDTLIWLYPKGMPMSLDIGQAVQKKMGGSGEQWFRTIGSMTDEEREIYRMQRQGGPGVEWLGWGTALRPSWEPICVFRKPMAEGSIAANVIEWGTGAINIDGSRIDGVERDAIVTDIPEGQGSAHGNALVKHQWAVGTTTLGRWPSGVLWDPEELDRLEINHPGTERFFWAPKAAKSEKDLGLPKGGNVVKGVKPLALCEWILNLICPPKQVVLDPFCGSGSTVLAADTLGLGAVGIDTDVHYVSGIAQKRLEALRAQPQKKKGK